MPAPAFKGDLDVNLYCLRHYKIRLLRWIRLTKEFLPGNEQALRARDRIEDDAENELAEYDDARYDKTDGIKQLLDDLEEPFGEKEMFTRGGDIRSYESISRSQGESVHVFTKRFKRLERKLKKCSITAYPEEARAIKLLDGLCLDERSTLTILNAACNKYQVAPILQALSIHYPANMTVTGMPIRQCKSAGKGSSYKPRYTSSKGDKGGKHQRHKGAWLTDANADDDHEDYDEDGEPGDDDEYYEYEEQTPAEECYEPVEDDEGLELQYGNEDDSAGSQALTPTSDLLEKNTPACGFYEPRDDKGHRKGSGKSGKSGKQLDGKNSLFNANFPVKASPERARQRLTLPLKRAR